MHRFAKLCVVSGLVLLGALALPQAHAKAKAKGKAKTPPACDLGYLPLVAGNSWVYTSGPDTLQVKVTGVAPGTDEFGKPATLIKVRESFAGKDVDHTWSCTKEGGLRVSPDSFFFVGEPGLRVGIEVKWTSHDDVWIHPDGNIVKDSGWQEKLKGDVTRPDTGGGGATHTEAKLEIERYALVKATETISLPIWQGDAVHIEFNLRGRVFLGANKTDITVIDDKNPGGVWLAKGVGVVRIKDNLKGGKTWELTSSSLLTP